MTRAYFKGGGTASLPNQGTLCEKENVKLYIFIFHVWKYDKNNVCSWWKGKSSPTVSWRQWCLHFFLLPRSPRQSLSCWCKVLYDFPVVGVRLVNTGEERIWNQKLHMIHCHFLYSIRIYSHFQFFCQILSIFFMTNTQEWIVQNVPLGGAVSTIFSGQITALPRYMLGTPGKKRNKRAVKSFLSENWKC